MNDLVNSLNYILDCGSVRLKMYIQSGDEKYMDDCKNYMVIANMYINELERSNEASSIKT